MLYIINMSRRNCINNSSFSYTGKEQSPLRYGLSAEGYPVNSILQGYDKNMWVVEVKNNRKIWIRKEEDFTITYEQPLINKLEDYNKSIEKTDNIKDIAEHDTEITDKDISTKKVAKRTVTESLTDKVVKKPTNYNIFLTYRLKKLKEQFKEESKQNKEIFKMVIKEWNEYKTKPEELKIILEEALSNT